jgi:hypothetical protein
MRNITSLYTIFLSVLFLGSTWSSLQAQVVADKFGQNRIQYEKKQWYRYLAPNFAISYAEGEEELARFVLPIIEADYVELSKLFEYKLRKRIEVMVYSDYSDYAQSNIGVEQHIINNGGVTDTRKPKILIYFNGDHNDLRRQIREGIATVILGKILAGTNIQEVVQNSVLMNLPKWFVLGAVAYAREEWSTDMDNQLRDILLQGKYSDFLAFSRKEPELAGQSLFHFISQVHGRGTVSNLLYLTRINRSVENGFLYVFGKTFYQVAGADWFNYYSNRYNADNTRRKFPNKGMLDLKIPKQTTVRGVKLSPDAKKMVYVQEKKGVQKVILFDLETNTEKMLAQFGHRDWTGDYDTRYPLVDWSGSNQLIVISEKKDKVQLQYLNITEDKKEKAQVLVGIERVLSFSVTGRNDILLTAIQEGHSDVYQYKNGNLRAITNDFWDDKEAVYATIGGKKGIIFSSNRIAPSLGRGRIKNELPMLHYDLFFYDLETKSKDLIQLTHTPFADEGAIIALKGGKFSYLSDVNGFNNRYISELDTVLWKYEKVLILEDETELTVTADTIIYDLPIDTSYLRPVYRTTGTAYANTDYSRSILEQDKGNGKIVDLFLRNGGYQVFVRTFNGDRSMEEVKKTVYKQKIELQGGIEKPTLMLDENPSVTPTITEITPEEDTPETPTVLEMEDPDTTRFPDPDTGKVDIDNYEFQNEFDNTTEPEISEEDGTTISTPTELVEENGEIKAKPKATNQQKITTNPTVKEVEWEQKANRSYQGLFGLTQIVLQFDNTPMYNNTDLFLGGYYQHQPLGVLGKIRFEDIYENFSIQLGIRMPLDFRGMEYFVDIENKKGLIDQRYSFYRRNRRETFVLVDTSNNISVEAQGRNIKHIVEGELRYPLSKTQSVRATGGVQLEKIAILADNLNTVQVPNFNQNNLHLRLEYVYDNTISMRYNTRKGLRFKGYMDMYKPFSVNTEEDFEVDLGGGLTTALGIDGRYYHTFDDKTIFAFRIAGATSFGEQKLLYSMGGVENWINPRTEEAIPLPSTDNFGLQTLAANLRGFGSNARNGSSYLLGNFEVRIPIMSYLSRRAPRNTMLRSLQIVGFFDVGTAWRGTSPFSRDNPLSTSVIDNNGPNTVSPVSVIVNYYRTPILMSYGVGIRTVLLGHYFRLDYAIGVETGLTQTPLLHISIGTDF